MTVTKIRTEQFICDRCEVDFSEIMNAPKGEKNEKGDETTTTQNLAFSIINKRDGYRRDNWCLCQECTTEFIQFIDRYREDGGVRSAGR